MDDEEETPEKARARKAAAEASSDLFPTKKRMKFQICPGSDEIQRPTPPEQITAIAMSDRPPPSDRGGGRREGPETPPVRESSNKKKTEPQRWMGVAAIERLRLPLQEITESNHPMQAAPRLQRRLEIAELERLKLQLEEKQKQSLGITGSNRPMQTKTPGTDEIERPKQMKAIATSDRPPPSDRGGGRREGPETPLVRESPKKKKKVPQRGMGIAALERLRLQMEEERKKKITASNRLLQAPPRSLELSSSQNEFRLQVQIKSHSILEFFFFFF
ncbi:hypothetical protein QJS04_geneDACA021966 [Acorus gramineus]|uniref:Uncharacterized protein n=1 Tax=Acorus gramineus TaxID=55184 RepID=A0AAV9AAB9_ACOGR|nr:hypothetical protein QJS04_geneDACA021966 [Acorus gramineus]